MTFSVSPCGRLRFNNTAVRLNGASQFTTAHTALFAVALFGEQACDTWLLNKRLTALGADLHLEFDAAAQFTPINSALQRYGWQIDVPCDGKTRLKLIPAKMAMPAKTRRSSWPSTLKQKKIRPMPAPATAACVSGLWQDCTQHQPLLILDEQTVAGEKSPHLAASLRALFTIIVFEDTRNDEAAVALRAAEVSGRPMSPDSVMTNIDTLRRVLTPHGYTISKARKFNELRDSPAERFLLIRAPLPQPS